MTISYNLLEEPWIPCIDDRRRLLNLNITEVVSQAHQVREIRSDLPVITGALLLFLIAYVMNIFKPESEQAWENLWRKGKFPLDKISRYNSLWHTRFDLFDQTHPFFQDPKFGAQSKDIKNLGAGKQPAPKGMSGLMLHLASGSNATLFDHSLDDSPYAYSQAETAQLLIMLQAYSLCGMSSASLGNDKYFKDSAFGRGITFLNRGHNLFETLLLNIPSINFVSSPSAEDIPCWERENLFEDERYQPDGIMDLLTWQSRRILLLPEELKGDIRVRFLLSAPGLSIVETYANPFYHNRISTDGAKQSIKPLRFQEGRSLWRDSTAILDLHSTHSENSLPVKWAAHLEVDEYTEKQVINLDLYGMCTQPGQKKAFFYAQETFTAPAVYLRERALVEQLEQGLAWAEQVRSDVFIAVRELARFIVAPMHDLEIERTPGREDTDPLIQHWNAENEYWSRLEPAFYDFLVNLPISDDAYVQWEKAIRRSARGALKYAADQVGSDPAGLKARAKSERSLEILMSRTFNPQGKE